MPPILDRLVSQLKAKGMDDEKAHAVAFSTMKKAGNIDANGKVTLKGAKRGRMTPAERAKDRAAKARGGRPEDYNYNPFNNSAVKGRINDKVKKRT